MRIENQVNNTDLGKQLWDLGVRRESYFVWYEDKLGEKKWTLIKYKYANLITYHAYTVAELGEMLPNEFMTEKAKKEWCCLKREINFDPYKENKDATVKQYFNIFAQTEADARAKMIIWLIKNNHITVENIN